ncbi:MAG: hypothetical protein Q8L86_12520 [Vicinamibacterales bacterium]|nr:hypothetical protein [Vicinamibacterales bacterium]
MSVTKRVLTLAGIIVFAALLAVAQSYAGIYNPSSSSGSSSASTTVVTSSGGTPTVGTSATSTATFESQQSIAFTGPAGRATTSQPLGTGYTQTAEAIQTVLFTGDASTTITLDECSSSGYSDCSIKATTGSFNLTGDGTTYVNASFTTPYAMKPDKYYRYFSTYGNASGRIQCGATASSTPITVGDNDQCGGASRAAVFKLNGFTTQPSVTASSTNSSFALTMGAATSAVVTFATSTPFTSGVSCGLTKEMLRNDFAVSSVSTTSITLIASSSPSGYTVWLNCIGR